MNQSSDTHTTTTLNSNNPLLQTWNTPHGTIPFHLIESHHFTEAIKQLIESSRETINCIANQATPPTFDNTLEALEKATLKLEEVSTTLFNLNECNTNPELQAIVLDLSPLLTRFSNEITMNRQLFERVEKIYNERENSNLTIEQKTVVEKYYRQFVQGGVGLSEEAQKEYAANAEELSRLTEEFNQNVLADTSEWTLHITDEAQLSGLPNNVRSAAAEEATAHNKQGWLFTLAYPSYSPFMTYADNRDLREEMWRHYNSRGNRGNKNDNNALIRSIVSLRLRQAQLLGYEDYASFKLSNTMAGDKATVEQFLDNLTKAALPHAEEELEAVKTYAREVMHFEGELQRWDFSYYSEKRKQALFQFDDECLRPYFPLYQVRQGIFDLYGTLYGLQFVENKEIPVYHDDATAYEIYDTHATPHRFMGVLYLDMHPRSNKSSGAWMTEFRQQSHIKGQEVRPLIQVVCNFTKPTQETPSLLSIDEVETFMHEMGHAIHGMLSDVTYPTVAGTNVRRDFVEMPSQVMENWCYEHDFLRRIARHCTTGDPMPDEYIDKVREERNYLSGYLCLRQLNLGKTDMAFHTLQQSLADEIDFSAEQFEQEQMHEMLPHVKGGNTSTAFTHIFAGGYAAGYYGYKWAEVLDADIFTRFKAEGIFNTTLAAEFRNKILSRGGSQHPAILFRDFMGRDPNPESLMKRCGL